MVVLEWGIILSVDIRYGSLIRKLFPYLELVLCVAGWLIG